MNDFMQIPSWMTSYFQQKIDAQVNFLWNKVRIKLGATNVLNQYYRSYLGGPSVGGFYYTSVTMNL